VRLGLFLTPGAARTAYQVGAARALVEEGGLAFEVIGASSVGAFNGAFVATGQSDLLADIWAGWRNRDVMGVDWAALLRGAVLWAPDLMDNRPETSQVDRHLEGASLLEGVRLRFNLADLAAGDDRVFEWPGAPLPLGQAVKASVAVPVVVRPVEALDRQWADGLTVDGFPLERMVLETGVERVFVVGVAPRQPDLGIAGNVRDAVLRAAELNQYSETWVGLERAAEVNELVAAWGALRESVAEALAELVPDGALRAELAALADDVVARAGFPYERRVVEVVSILPERPIDMWFGDFQPERSRRLLAQGRADALAVLAGLEGSDRARTHQGP
jgi:predicted acylesterase/phospholipase RssA